MTSLQQDRLRSRHGPGLRPLVIGALACGALLTTAPAALADHRMANGMLCPHAAGEPVPGEGPATVNPAGAASTAPIAAVGASSAPSAQPAKPQAKPAQQAKAQRPASQAQAQRPATSQAQAQQPAQAQRPAAKVAAAPVPGATRTITRQAPRSAASSKPQAKVVEHKPAVRPAQRPAVHPDDLRAAVAVPTTSPAASAVEGGQSAASGVGALLLALLALGGLGVVAVLAFVRRRTAPDAVLTSTQPTLLEEVDAAIEAELQAMIAESRARTVRTPDVVEDVDDAHELSASR